MKKLEIRANAALRICLVGWGVFIFSIILSKPALSDICDTLFPLSNALEKWKYGEKNGAEIIVGKVLRSVSFAGRLTKRGANLMKGELKSAKRGDLVWVIIKTILVDKSSNLIDGQKVSIVSIIPTNLNDLREHYIYNSTDSDRKVLYLTIARRLFPESKFKDLVLISQGAKRKISIDLIHTQFFPIKCNGMHRISTDADRANIEAIIGPEYLPEE